MSGHTNPEHRNITSTPDYLPELGATALPSGCQSYGTGHAVHWIRMSHASNSEWVPADIDAVDGHFITFTHGDTTVHRWNHDAERLRAVTDLVLLESDADIRWSDRYNILQVTIGDKAWLFGLEEGSGTPCSYAS